MNKATKKRFDALASIGCSVCRTQWGIYTPAVIHHALGLENGRMIGRKAPDDKTLPLCVEHHSGFLGIHRLGKREWETMFGSQAWHIEECNRLIGGIQ